MTKGLGDRAFIGFTGIDEDVKKYDMNRKSTNPNFPKMVLNSLLLKCTFWINQHPNHYAKEHVEGLKLAVALEQNRLKKY